MIPARLEVQHIRALPHGAEALEYQHHGLPKALVAWGVWGDCRNVGANGTGVLGRYG
jgi:hypothetical protein